MEIKKITKFQTDDGAEHLTVEMACQHLLNEELVSIFAYMDGGCDSQEIINCISSNAKKVREFLDACDAMEKAGR
jgi:hypothetical protein